MKSKRGPSYWTLGLIGLVGFIAFMVLGYQIVSNYEDSLVLIPRVADNAMELEAEEGIYIFASNDIEVLSTDVSMDNMVVETNLGTKYITVSFTVGDIALYEPDGCPELVDYTCIGLIYSEDGVLYTLNTTSTNEYLYYSPLTTSTYNIYGLIGVIIVFATFLAILIASVIIKKKKRLYLEQVNTEYTPNPFENEFGDDFEPTNHTEEEKDYYSDF